MFGLDAAEFPEILRSGPLKPEEWQQLDYPERRRDPAFRRQLLAVLGLEPPDLDVN